MRNLAREKKSRQDIVDVRNNVKPGEMNKMVKKNTMSRDEEAARERDKEDIAEQEAFE